MKKVLGFLIIAGFLWFCLFSYNTIEDRNADKLTEDLIEAQATVAEKHGKIKVLEDEVEALKKERDNLKSLISGNPLPVDEKNELASPAES